MSLVTRRSEDELEVYTINRLHCDVTTFGRLHSDRISTLLTPDLSISHNMFKLSPPTPTTKGDEEIRRKVKISLGTEIWVYFILYIYHKRPKHWFDLVSSQILRSGSHSS